MKKNDFKFSKYSLNKAEDILSQKLIDLIKSKINFEIKNLKKDYIKKIGNSLRPNLNLGEGIFFHPDLVHGDSENLGTKTRVSLEIRFYRREIKNSKPQGREIKRKLLN